MTMIERMNRCGDRATESQLEPGSTVEAAGRVVRQSRKVSSA